MRLDKYASEILSKSYMNAQRNHYEYLTPEYVMYNSLSFKNMQKFLLELGINVDIFEKDLSSYLDENLLKIEGVEPMNSMLLENILSKAALQKASAGKEVITYYDIILAMYDEEESFVSFLMKKQGLKRIDILEELTKSFDPAEMEDIEEYEDDIDISYIENYATNLSEMAEEGVLDPLIGREDILERTIQVLLRRRKSNPIHIGEAGVGKTSITEGLAQLINKGEVPNSLKNATIYSVDLTGLVAGTKYRGDFEDRIKNLFDEISFEDNPIVYIDEIHTLIGTGANANNSMDASSLIKPYLMSNKIKFIGSTTYDEYKKYIEKNKAFLRRFQTIDVNEPSVEQSIEILKGLKIKYEQFHKASYTIEAIEAACRLSDKYLQDRHLPDKAIDLIDETAAFLRIKAKHNRKIKINEIDIEKTVAKLARIPEEKVEKDEIQKLGELDTKLKQNLFGQDNAVEAVVKSIKRSRAGFNEENKPIASFLFVGSTGVGKTELAKQVSNLMGIPLIRFDMSEYQEKHSVAKLIGTPPGYVGYEEGGMLIDSIRKNPHCVLLLDEIEKAHSDIFNVLLQIMDYATLTENNGRKADFRNVVIVMTSNAGASDIEKSVVGFGNKQVGDSSVGDAVKRTFSPEFRNRLSSVVVFNQLNEETAVMIVKKETKKFNKKLAEKNVSLKLTPSAQKFVAKKAFSTKFGAREILRFFDKEIKDWFVDKVLFGELRNGGKVTIGIKNNEMKFEIK